MSTRTVRVLFLVLVYNYVIMFLSLKNQSIFFGYPSFFSKAKALTFCKVTAFILMPFEADGWYFRELWGNPRINVKDTGKEQLCTWGPITGWMTEWWWSCFLFFKCYLFFWTKCRLQTRMAHMHTVERANPFDLYPMARWFGWFTTRPRPNQFEWCDGSSCHWTVPWQQIPAAQPPAISQNCTSKAPEKRSLSGILTKDQKYSCYKYLNVGRAGFLTNWTCLGQAMASGFAFAVGHASAGGASFFCFPDMLSWGWCGVPTGFRSRWSRRYICAALARDVWKTLNTICRRFECTYNAGVHRIELGMGSQKKWQWWKINQSGTPYVQCVRQRSLFFVFPSLCLCLSLGHSHGSTLHKILAHRTLISSWRWTFTHFSMFLFYCNWTWWFSTSMFDSQRLNKNPVFPATRPFTSIKRFVPAKGGGEESTKVDVQVDVVVANSPCQYVSWEAVEVTRGQKQIESRWCFWSPGPVAGSNVCSFWRWGNQGTFMIFFWGNLFVGFRPWFRVIFRWGNAYFLSQDLRCRRKAPSILQWAPRKSCGSTFRSKRLSERYHSCISAVGRESEWSGKPQGWYFRIC